jgi:polyphosphate kinase
MSHIEETPITGRKRFISLKQKQMDSIYEFRFREMKEIYKIHILPSNDKNVDKVMKIALKLIQSNNDFEQIQDKDWTISLINYPNV